MILRNEKEAFHTSKEKKIMARSTIFKMIVASIFFKHSMEGAFIVHLLLQFLCCSFSLLYFYN